MALIASKSWVFNAYHHQFSRLHFIHEEVDLMNNRLIQYSEVDFGKWCLPYDVYTIRDDRRRKEPTCENQKSRPSVTNERKSRKRALVMILNQVFRYLLVSFEADISCIRFYSNLTVLFSLSLFLYLIHVVYSGISLNVEKLYCIADEQFFWVHVFDKPFEWKQASASMRSLN